MIVPGDLVVCIREQNGNHLLYPDWIHYKVGTVYTVRSTFVGSRTGRLYLRLVGVIQPPHREPVLAHLGECGCWSEVFRKIVKKPASYFTGEPIHALSD